MSNFSAGKQVVRPPQRGIFPLDHDAECRESMKTYLNCLSESNNDHYRCRDLSKAYLQCRMDHKLMAEEDLDKLGFSKENEITQATSVEGLKEAKGFIAGKHIEKDRKWFWQGN